MGNDPVAAERAGYLFRQHDIESLTQLADVWGDDQNYGIAVRQRMDDLKQVLSQDDEARKTLNTCKEP